MKIVESFRDAVQGLSVIIPTEDKIRLLKAYLKVGFEVLDAGSFVSPEYVPQFKDMEAVLEGLAVENSATKLMLMVASKKGMRRALDFENIDFIVFPFSPSEKFLQKNINCDMQKALGLIDEIQNLCVKSGKELWLYYAMAFGNPYGDLWSPDALWKMTERMQRNGIVYQSYADTIGIADEKKVAEIFGFLSRDFAEIKTGFHLHSSVNDWYPLINAAWEGGCEYFDGVLSGLGGCPMTGYELKSNLATANLLQFAKEKNVHLQLDEKKFWEAKILSDAILHSVV